MLCRGHILSILMSTISSVLIDHQLFHAIIDVFYKAVYVYIILTLFVLSIYLSITLKHTSHAYTFLFSFSVVLTETKIIAYLCILFLFAFFCVFW
jgi:hypothetical protein